MRGGARGILSALALFVSACTLPSAPLPSTLTRSDGPPERNIMQEENFILHARFSLAQNALPGAQEAPRQFAGRLRWRHAANGDEWFFSDPLGQGVALVQGRPDGSFAWNEQTFASQEALEEALGIPLPLAELVSWIQAKPGRGALVEADQQGRPWRVRESGWLLLYHYADDGETRPVRLDASLENLKLKLFIESREPSGP
ncbi:MAG: outer membrane lipoprotein LolB [Zoogloeaceae bacterium]|jgi:outer membrane biogenesis lipoprotein LolB|nr:outer membrane lipoprotein LolB [Zoogloeaceae bacterium]